MLFAALAAVMCGYDSYVAFARFTELNLEWLRGLGCAFANGVPSHDTFRYAFSVVNHGIFSASLRTVAAILRDKAKRGNVSIDLEGCTYRHLRSTRRRRSKQRGSTGASSRCTGRST